MAPLVFHSEHILRHTNYRLSYLDQIPNMLLKWPTCFAVAWNCQLMIFQHLLILQHHNNREEHPKSNQKKYFHFVFYSCRLWKTKIGWIVSMTHFLGIWFLKKLHFLSSHRWPFHVNEDNQWKSHNQFWLMINEQYIFLLICSMQSAKVETLTKNHFSPVFNVFDIFFFFFLFHDNHARITLNFGNWRF